MVEARQRSLRSFIFIAGQEEETIAYIQKHFVLLKDFLLVFTYENDVTAFERVYESRDSVSERFHAVFGVYEQAP